MFVLYPFGANVKATKKLVAPFSLASNKFKIKLTVKLVLLTNLSLLLTNFYSSLILIPSKVNKVCKVIEDLAKMMELSCPSFFGRFSRYLILPVFIRVSRFPRLQPVTNYIFIFRDNFLSSQGKDNQIVISRNFGKPLALVKFLK